MLVAGIGRRRKRASDGLVPIAMANSPAGAHFDSWTIEDSLTEARFDSWTIKNSLTKARLDSWTIEISPAEAHF